MDDERQTSATFSNSDVGRLWPGTMQTRMSHVTDNSRTGSISLFVWRKVPRKTSREGTISQQNAYVPQLTAFIQIFMDLKWSGKDLCQKRSSKLRQSQQPPNDLKQAENSREESSQNMNRTKNGHIAAGLWEPSQLGKSLGRGPAWLDRSQWRSPPNPEDNLRALETSILVGPFEDLRLHGGCSNAWPRGPEKSLDFNGLNNQHLATLRPPEWYNISYQALPFPLNTPSPGHCLICYHLSSFVQCSYTILGGVCQKTSRKNSRCFFLSQCMSQSPHIGLRSSSKEPDSNWQQHAAFDPRFCFVDLRLKRRKRSNCLIA